ncbi:MAG: DUF2142 domain-containing protein [Lachnospiraceae bacterium]|nr:DUF2142 domain-containing protein [Lachnospiraceae bacterium]
MLSKDKKELLLEYGRRYGIMLAFICIMLVVYCKAVKDVIVANTGLTVVLVLLGVLITALCVISMVIFEKQLHKFYIIVFALLGGIYFFIYPIGTVPDEQAHFYRAYEISEGHMVSDIQDGYGGRMLPDNLGLGINALNTSIKETWDKMDVELSENRSFSVFWTMSLYAPVSYIPQSLGILMARIFTDSIAVMFMAGRLFNFIAVAVISYLAVKYMPFGKKILIMVMLLPINMQEAISLAPDAMVTALTLAFVAYVLHLRYKQETKMSGKQLVLLYILAIVVSLYKIVYLPFCMLPFLIPMDRFGGKKKFIIHAVCMGTAVIVLSLGWLAFAGRYLMDIEGGRDSGAQVEYILGDIPNYFRVMGTTLKLHGINYLYMMLGHILSWLNLFIPKGYLIPYAIILLAGIVSDEEKLPEKFGAVRAMFVLISVAVFLLTLTSLYVQWNNYASPIIEGVQGRYFIPIILPLTLAVSFCLPRSLGKLFGMKNLMIPMVVVNLVVMVFVFDNFGISKAMWVEADDGWKYYVKESGYVTSSWYQVDTEWYYFGDDGYMYADEWLEYKGDKYLFTDGGVMATGWQLYGDEWYYLDSDGTAYTGWIESEGDWYYCEDGKMWYDCVTPDGYKLDKDGKMIEQ